jgi:hypothetical protein
MFQWFGYCCRKTRQLYGAIDFYEKAIVEFEKVMIIEGFRIV